jgi:hypothetical protein
MTAGSARSDLGSGRSLSVARDSEVGPSVVVAGRTLGSWFARWDPRLFVALPGCEVRVQPGLTSGAFSLGGPSGLSVSQISLPARRAFGKDDEPLKWCGDGVMVEAVFRGRGY